MTLTKARDEREALEQLRTSLTFFRRVAGKAIGILRDHGVVDGTDGVFGAQIARAAEVLRRKRLMESECPTVVSVAAEAVDAMDVLYRCLSAHDAGREDSKTRFVSWAAAAKIGEAAVKLGLGGLGPLPSELARQNGLKGNEAKAEQSRRKKALAQDIGKRLIAERPDYRWTLNALAQTVISKWPIHGAGAFDELECGESDKLPVPRVRSAENYLRPLL